MREPEEFIRQRGFHLPPFAYWTPAEWRSKGEEAREIVGRFPTIEEDAEPLHLLVTDYPKYYRGIR